MSRWRPRRRFSPGDLFIVGRGLPHYWITPLKAGERVLGRDVILQFDEDRILAASSLLREIEAVRTFLAFARRGILFHGQTRTRGSELIEAIGSAQGLERLSLFFALLYLLATSTDRSLLSSAGFAAHAGEEASQSVREVLTWMAANYYSDVRLAQAAAMA